MFSDFRVASRHILSMSSEPLTLQEKQAAEYHARWEAVETVKAQELAAMTEDRALEIIRSLVPTAINNMTYSGCALWDSLPGFSRSDERNNATHKPIHHPTQQLREDSPGNSGQEIYVTVLFRAARQDNPVGCSGPRQ